MDDADAAGGVTPWQKRQAYLWVAIGQNEKRPWWRTWSGFAGATRKRQLLFGSDAEKLAAKAVPGRGGDQRGAGQLRHYTAGAEAPPKLTVAGAGAEGVCLHFLPSPDLSAAQQDREGLAGPDTALTSDRTQPTVRARTWDRGQLMSEVVRRST